MEGKNETKEGMRRFEGKGGRRRELNDWDPWQGMVAYLRLLIPDQCWWVTDLPLMSRACDVPTWQQSLSLSFIRSLSVEMSYVSQIIIKGGWTNRLRQTRVAMAFRFMTWIKDINKRKMYDV